MKLQKAALVFVAAAVSAMAQDPPSRVARLSLLEGPVSFQPDGVDEWTGATLNYPLTTGDHIYNDQGARSELRVGPNAIRLAGQTNFGFLNLDDQTIQMRLTEGSLIVRVRLMGDQDVWEVDTPNGAITLLRSGEYRIDTDPNRNATMVTVRGGEAEVTANGQNFPVRAGQTAYFSGDGREESIQAANPPDDFDRYSQDRDRRDDSIPAPRYVSQQMVGYEDLDRYGAWEPGEEDGPVWRPRVRADWAPYRDGHWAWRDPWGWTWIDDAPWGFAPFHYGRWAYVRGGWGWYPGPVVARPVYAPALVAFVGGGNFSLSVGVGGGGGVGWFPLGPREVYRPVYRVSQRYERDLNGRNYNFINNRNVYLNRNAPGAFTAISRQDFVASRPVGRYALRGSQDQFRSAPVLGFSPGVAPQRESFFGRAQGGNVARPRDAVFNREVIARTAPPAARVSFESRQQALRDNQGRPLAPEQLDQLRGRQSNVRQPAVRSAISPGQGFGRNSGSPVPANNGGFGRNQDGRPVQTVPNVNQPAVNQNGGNQGFGRGAQRNDAAPQNVPQAAPQAAPQPNATPNNGNGRGQGRNQDRFDSRPGQVAPRTDTGQQQDNRGFGRNQQQQTAPQPSPQVIAPQSNPQQGQETQQPNRGFGRSSRPESVAPQQQQQQQPQVVQPQQDNRGFGRGSQRQAPTPSEPPAPPASRSEGQAPNRGFGRAAQQPETQPAPAPAPRNEAPAQNRGFGRAQQEPKPDAQQAPRAERPAENRGFGRARPEGDKPKDEKPK